MSKRFPTHPAGSMCWLMVASLLLCASVSAATAPGQGDKLANDGNYVAAEQVFATAHEQTPKDVATIVSLARINLMLGKNKQALQWVQKAVAMEPDNVEYRMLLGDVYSAYVNDVSLFSKLGIAHKVRDTYRKAVALKPDDADAHFRLAMFYLLAPGIAGGSKDKADKQIRMLEKLDPAMAGILRARQANKDEQYAQAEDLLTKAGAVGKDGSAYLLLGQLLISRKRPADALAVFRKAIAAHPDQPDAYYQIGKLAAEGKIDAQAGAKALQAYLGMTIDWRNSNPPFCWAHYRLAQIRTRLGQADKARAEYQKALALNPNFKQAKQALQKAPTT